ncbi:Ras-related protein Rab-13 [Nematocida homosporus]|uniref:Ras-related protein Rab-13 n=1 Tax=Nematocida homosporus TaxID=1912981 RepID=UPI00222028B8|nr:Ras-related protein Rab-13 [Nematocida homosporus]KAI5187752.1 Ras-related protein Rab-13 [Nematocida homosporus]
MEDNDVAQLKLLIIGESGVGKTSILQRFIENVFKKGFTSTIGIDFRSKRIKVDGVEVELQIWDTAGQERFFSITKSYYRGSDGIFLTFDISSENSFRSTEKWMAAIRSKVDENVPIFLLANKKDLIDSGAMDSLRTVQNIKSLSGELGIPWYATSAQSGENIEEIFTDMARIILSKKQPSQPKKKKRFTFSTRSLKKAFSCW